MRKFLLFVFMLVLIPFNVNGATANSKVGYDLKKYECTSAYQDSNISTSGEAYFSYCMQATCKDNAYKITYYSADYENRKVNCLNGNNDPYYNLDDSRNGCKNYNSCDNEGLIKYCSIIMYYDCSRKSDGSSFPTTTKSTTTKATKTTKKRTTAKTTITTSTTTEAIVSTKLKSLSLSKGSINFNSDVYEYTITLEKDDTTVDVTAVAEDINNSVNVSGNTNLENGSAIIVRVTGKDNSSSVYKINVKKEVELSSNAYLSSLTIKDYDLQFSSKIYDYSLEINEGVSSLSINYVTEDNNAKVMIDGNNNLVDGSKISVKVYAEDGTTNEYIINISVKSSSNVLGIIFIIVIVLVILVGAYYLYKKFVLDKKGDKYEYE